MILVDYVCAVCTGVQERWAPSPPPAFVECKHCGGDAQRRFAAIGLSGAAAPAVGPPTRSPGQPLCSQYPQIPALCHMSESAGRMWVAKYKKDNRAIETELSRQEIRARERPPIMADAITHTHHAKPATSETI